MVSVPITKIETRCVCGVCRSIVRVRAYKSPDYINCTTGPPSRKLRVKIDCHFERVASEGPTSCIYVLFISVTVKTDDVMCEEMAKDDGLPRDIRYIKS